MTSYINVYFILVGISKFTTKHFYTEVDINIMACMSVININLKNIYQNFSGSGILFKFLNR